MPVTLSEFLNRLFRDGRVRVPRPAGISDTELRAADGVLSAFEQEYRQELPATPPPPPPLCLPAARWAATMLYQACQFVAFRDADEETVARTLAVACPHGDPAAVHYSVDLTFRYLPGLIKLGECFRAGSAAGAPCPLGGPVAALIGRDGRRWTAANRPLARDPCLSGLYVDRVIALRDASRLSDPPVRDAVQQAVGLFPELAAESGAARWLPAQKGATPRDLDVEDLP